MPLNNYRYSLEYLRASPRAQMELKVARAEPEPGIAGSKCSLSLRFLGSAQVQHLHLGSESYGVTLLLK